MKVCQSNKLSRCQVLYYLHYRCTVHPLFLCHRFKPHCNIFFLQQGRQFLGISFVTQIIGMTTFGTTPLDCQLRES